MPSNLDVIASRTLQLRHEDGTTSPVVVRIGRPHADTVDYRCDYEIEGLSKMRALRIGGVDEVQALWLALVGVGVELRTSAEGKEGRLAFNGEKDLSFPSAEQLSEPEWHEFIVDGETLHWRTYPSWQKTAEGALTRSSALEVARRPNGLGAGTSYPYGTVVGQEQARALARFCREQGTPIV